MIRSMTGYGRFENQNGKYSCAVEVRSVNNRHMEIKTKVPKYLSQLEIPLKNLIKTKCSRGSLELSVTIKKNEAVSDNPEIKPNLQLASQYLEALNQIKNTLKLKGNIDINSILSLKDLIKFEPLELDSSQVKMVMNTVEEAIDELIKMRQEEGVNLQSDIRKHLKEIANLIEFIQTRQPRVLQEYKDKLKVKISILSQGVSLDETRLAQETAIMADRCDVTEELTRIRSHLQQFNELVVKEGPLGRKLEFINQEINREANTIASKTIDYQISQSVIELKSSSEKIREQILNIE